MLDCVIKSKKINKSKSLSIFIHVYKQIKRPLCLFVLTFDNDSETFAASGIPLLLEPPSPQRLGHDWLLFYFLGSSFRLHFFPT